MEVEQERAGGGVGVGPVLGQVDPIGARHRALVTWINTVFRY